MTRYLSATEDEPNREALELVRRCPLPPACTLCQGRHAPDLHGPQVATRETGHDNQSLKGLPVLVRTWANREARTVRFQEATIRSPMGTVLVRFASGKSKHVSWFDVWYPPRKE